MPPGGRGSGQGNLSRTSSGMRATSGGPPGVKFEMDFQPSAQSLGMAFERWATLIDDWRPIWSDVITLFKRHEKRSFDSEGSSTGQRWAALSPAYREWKERHFPGRMILVLRGSLRLALTEGGPGWVSRQTKRSLEAGLNAQWVVGKIGGYHAFGTPFMPARPPVRYSAAVLGGGEIGGGGVVPFGTAVAQLFQIHIVEARKKAMKAAGVQPDPFGKAGSILGRKRGVLALKTR